MPATSEETPLLSDGQHESKSFLQRQALRLKCNVSRSWADIVLILLYFDTGLVDGSSTSTWGSFVSMQTGNTIYVGLGIADPGTSNRWLKALISVLFFMFGSMVFGFFHRSCGPRIRWVLVASYAFQSLCIIFAGVMVSEDLVDGNSMRWPNVLSIALLSFQSSGQAVASQVMGYGELPTIVLTSVYRDLMSDVNLFALKPAANPKRNRRVGAIVLLCAGAAVSKVIGNSPAGLAGSLWTSAVLKALVAVTWAFWAAEKDSD